MTPTKTLSRAFALALPAAALFVAADAFACVSPPPTPVVTVFGSTASPNDVCIRVGGYSTFGAFPGEFCSCAMTVVPSLESVYAARVVDVATDEGLAGFAFESSADAAAAWTDAYPTVEEVWSAFLSPISQDVDADTAVELEFCGTLLDESTLEDLAEDLTETEGGIGSDGAEEDGELHMEEGHHGVVIPDEVTIERRAALNVIGECPGPVTIELTGMTPRGKVYLFKGDGAGSDVIPGGPCGGEVSGLNNLARQNIYVANDAGVVILEPDLPIRACGRFLQAIDVTTCDQTDLDILD